MPGVWSKGANCWKFSLQDLFKRPVDLDVLWLIIVNYLPNLEIQAKYFQDGMSSIVVPFSSNLSA
jgi:hypothetical protein